MTRAGWETEPLVAGEIRTWHDRGGRRVRARYFHRGRPRSWELRIDPERETAELKSPDGMGAYCCEGGTVRLYTAWHDGPATEEEGVTYERFVADCLEDFRDRAWVYLRRDALEAAHRGRWREAHDQLAALDRELTGRTTRDDHRRPEHLQVRLELAVAAARLGTGAGAAAAAALERALEEGEPKGDPERLELAAAALAPADLEAALRAFCRGAVRRAATAGADADKALQALQGRVAAWAVPGATEWLLDAARAAAPDSAACGRFVGYHAGRTGARGASTAEAALRRLRDAGEARVADLNNLSHVLLVRGSLDEAEAVIDQVAALLAPRGPAPLDGDDHAARLDEYFHATNRATLLWVRGRYDEALPHARRAFALERALSDRTACTGSLCGPTPRYAPELAYSGGSWALVSTLTRCGALDQAEQVFGAALADQPRMRARLEGQRESAEHLLLAGSCIYTENRTPAMLQRLRPVFRRMRRVVPQPQTLVLAHQYACLAALLGNRAGALRLLHRAVALGCDPRELRADTDFDGIRDDPDFARALERA